MNRPWTMAIFSVVGKAIEEYTGRKLTALKAFEDPKVDGTYAFRATFTDDAQRGGLDFLTIGVPLDSITSDDLEETEYNEWPPKSKGITQWMVS